MPPVVESDAFNGVSKYNCVLKVPFESIEVYKQANGWKDFSNIEGIVSPVTKLELNATDIILNKGEKYQLTVSITPSFADNKTVTWASSNTSVAAVDVEGKVTAVGAGTATITTTANDGSGVSASCKVTVSVPTCATPTFSQSGDKLTISCTTNGATIYYTLDGTTPTTSSTKYTAPITLSYNCTIKAISTKANMNNSTVVSYTVNTFTAATPTFSQNEDVLTISCATEGATKYYTLNGTPPTTASTKYTGPITLTESCTVKAIAVKENFNNSEVATYEAVIEEKPIDITNKTTFSTSTQIGAGKEINIKQGGVLTVTGTQALAIKTLSMYLGESNPGALINNCSKLTAGSVIARFAVSANTWHFITPMSDVKIDDVTHSNDGAFIFRQYDAAKRAQNGKGNCWADVTDGVLHAGQGYILRSNKAGEIIMPMPKAGSSDMFCTTDRSFALNSHSASSLADEDWNFVGNPYPCCFNIQSMDCNVPVTVREGNKYTAYTVTDDNYTLRPMQAFFLQKPDNANTILFHKEGRTSSSASKVRSKMPTDNGRKVFDILLSDGESADRTRVVINDEASLEYERECDAAKFESEDADAAQIYSIGEHGTRFAINERPMLDGIVELGITLGTHGSYTISLGHGNDAVSLYDAETQQTVELNTTDYEFTASAGECRNRFYLYFDDATNIHSTHSSKSSVQSPVFYNLNGQAVGKNYKGIVISNGKKIVR